MASELITSASKPRGFLATPSYLRLWFAGGIGNAMRWLELLVAGIFTYEVTHSTVLVALVIVARRLPMPRMGFSTWDGEIPRDTDSPLEGTGFEPSVPPSGLTPRPRDNRREWSRRALDDLFAIIEQVMTPQLAMRSSDMIDQGSG